MVAIKLLPAAMTRALAMTIVRRSVADASSPRTAASRTKRVTASNA